MGIAAALDWGHLRADFFLKTLLFKQAGWFIKYKEIIIVKRRLFFLPDLVIYYFKDIQHD